VLTQLQISLISCDGALASTWGHVSTTSPAFAGAKSGAGVPASAALGAVCAATPAALLAKLLVVSTTSGNIAKKQIRKRFQGIKGRQG
jgi:hypothetical protein